MRKIKLIIVMCFTIAAAAFGFSWVKVDETEYVLITEFGRRVALYGGPGKGGIYFQPPWRSAIRIDRRLRVFDPPAREVITGDKRNLDVSSYVAWRVIDPEAFVKSSGTAEAAEARLGERTAAALGDAVGKRDLDAIASSDPKLWKLDDLATEVLRAVARPARDELGIEVIDIRLRRFNYPLEVRPAVFDLIRGERKRVAASLRAEGEAKYQTIISRAERDRDAILAKADADAERIRADGEAEATRTLNDAHSREPKFYEYLRTLESYKAMLDEKTTVVLSSASPLLRLLTQGPPADLLYDSPPPADAGRSAVSPAGDKPEVKP
jgi:membrane protease subunit HflC